MLIDALHALRSKCLFCLIVNGSTTPTILSNICFQCLQKNWYKVESGFGKTYWDWRRDDMMSMDWSCISTRRFFQALDRTTRQQEHPLYILQGIMCRVAYLVRGLCGFGKELCPNDYGRWLVEKATTSCTNIVVVFLTTYVHVLKLRVPPKQAAAPVCGPQCSCTPCAWAFAGLLHLPPYIVCIQ